MAEEVKAYRKGRIGIVVSDKMEKTIVVRVDRMAKDQLYGKPVLRSKKFMAHDETNDCHIGDRVLIEETRPLSAHKHWEVTKIVERAHVLGNDPLDEKEEEI
jgi:small subunit ribosomal protein S17